MGSRAASPPTGRILRLAIKNMVCPRCVEAVRTTLEELGCTVEDVVLGEARVRTTRPVPADRIDAALRRRGFALLIDRDTETVERIKLALLEYLRAQEEARRLPRRSLYLASRLGMPYRQLSRTFRRQEPGGINRYYISLRIERVKELIAYGELTVSAIADLLGFSSVHHLSAQFRSVTGLSISDARPTALAHRHPLDALR